MSTALHRTINTPTPQNKQADPTQVKNSAGGYVFQISPQAALERFLILGSEGGTYYANEKDLTKSGMALVSSCVASMAPNEFFEIVERCAQVARKRSYALYAISEALVSGSDEHKARAPHAVLAVCKTGTDVFELASYVRGRRGWGTTVRKAFDAILLGLPEDKLALWSVKYRDRFGYTWRDLLRLQHTRPDTPKRDAVLGHMANKQIRVSDTPDVITGYVLAKGLTDEQPLIRVINEYHLPWEALTDEQRTDEVWKACLPNIGDTAVLRNVASFTRRKMDADFTFRQNVSARIANTSKLHPVQVLDALKTYGSGGTVGQSRGGTYVPNARWMESMEDALERSFTEGVNTTGQNIYVGLDVSGSMGSLVSGSHVLSCREVGAALALGFVKAEDEVGVFGFTDGQGRRVGWSNFRDDVVMSHLAFTKRTAFADALRQTDGLPFGGTDCALPMMHALEQKIAVDTFVVITDNETWAGGIHPMEALNTYRRLAKRPNAKLAVIALTATNFSIADPRDRATMDFVGFSSDLPRSLEKFMTMT